MQALESKRANENAKQEYTAKLAVTVNTGITKNNILREKYMRFLSKTNSKTLLYPLFLFEFFS
jgi:hypothetical protein